MLRTNRSTSYFTQTKSIYNYKMLRTNRSTSYFTQTKSIYNYKMLRTNRSTCVIFGQHLTARLSQAAQLGISCVTIEHPIYIQRYVIPVMHVYTSASNCNHLRIAILTLFHIMSTDTSSSDSDLDQSPSVTEMAIPAMGDLLNTDAIQMDGSPVPSQDLHMCSICIQAVRVTAETVWCTNHPFHVLCFRQSILRDSRCPNCRKEWSTNPPVQEGAPVEVEYQRIRSIGTDDDPLFFSAADLLSPTPNEGEIDIHSPWDINLTPENADARSVSSNYTIIPTPVAVMPNQSVSSSSTMTEDRITARGPLQQLPPLQSRMRLPAWLCTMTEQTAPNFPRRIEERGARVWSRPPNGRPFPSMTTSFRACPYVLPTRSNQQSIDQSTTSAGMTHVPSSRTVGRSQVVSSSTMEQVNWDKIVFIWKPLLQDVFQFSTMLKSIQSNLDMHVDVILKMCSSNTLRRHLPGWRCWYKLASLLTYPSANPALNQLLDCIETIRSGELQDRGRKSRHLTKVGSMISAMRFVARTFALPELQSLLHMPIVTAWCRSELSNNPLREAVPLPLVVIGRLEFFLMENWSKPSLEEECSWILGFLLMLFGGLRFSDIQRSWVKQIVCGQGTVRWSAYRTKTAKHGMPIALLSTGIYFDWSECILKLTSSFQQMDFWFRGSSGPASYSATLTKFRYILLIVGKLQESEVIKYTLHSLKATITSWFHQLDLPELQRLSIGHHRLAGARSVAALYGRDDVLPGLRGLWSVTQAIRQGWVPLTPQSRGSEMPQEETKLDAPALQDVIQPNWLTVAPQIIFNSVGTSSSSQPEHDLQAKNDSESSATELEDVSLGLLDDEEETLQDVDMWLLNTKSKIYHIAIMTDSGADPIFSTACNTHSIRLSATWSLVKEDPALSDNSFVPCSKAGCYFSED